MRIVKFILLKIAEILAMYIAIHIPWIVGLLAWHTVCQVIPRTVDLWFLGAIILVLVFLSIVLLVYIFLGIWCLIEKNWEWADNIK